MENQKEVNIKLSISDRYNAEAQGCCTTLSCGQPLMFIDPKPGESILDIGYGKGNEMIRAAQAVGEHGKVYGIDVAEFMQQVATQNAADNGITNCEFLLGEAESIPLPDDTVDGVISNCVINHSLDKENVYREIYRVLKSGGRFVISDIYAKEALSDNIKNDPKLWAECIAGAITKDEYFEAITKAGFVNIKLLSDSISKKKAAYGIWNMTIAAEKI